MELAPPCALVLKLTQHGGRQGRGAVLRLYSTRLLLPSVTYTPSPVGSKVTPSGLLGL